MQMLLYSDTQMSCSHTNIGNIHIARTSKFIHNITNQMNRRSNKQIDGVTMSCSLDLTLENIFLGSIKQKLFKNKSDFLPSVYLRHVNDIYCVFDTENPSLEFLQMLNSQHAAIKFTIKVTIEKETNSKSLSFFLYKFN